MNFKNEKNNILQCFFGKIKKLVDFFIFVQLIHVLFGTVNVKKCKMFENNKISRMKKIFLVQNIVRFIFVPLIHVLSSEYKNV